MPDTEVPRAATTWIVGATALVASVFIWLTVRVAETAAWPWYAVLLFALSWIALGVLALSGLLIQALTRLDSQGVSQVSLRGTKRMMWKDVLKVSQRHMGTLVLSDDSTSVVIAPIVYNNADAVHKWIRSKLEQAGAPAMSKIGKHSQ